MECEHVSKENVLQVLKQQHLFHIHGLRSTKWYSTLLRFIKIFSSFYRKNTVEFLMCDDNLETIGITLNTARAILIAIKWHKWRFILSHNLLFNSPSFDFDKLAIVWWEVMFSITVQNETFLAINPFTIPLLMGWNNSSAKCIQRQLLDKCDNSYSLPKILLFLQRWWNISILDWIDYIRYLEWHNCRAD